MARMPNQKETRQIRLTFTVRSPMENPAIERMSEEYSG